ncbi:peptidase M10A and M12B matrixin and adamalysin (plasmid) [Stanieria cyanosphaera PCC 7437]|uniref:Peptidase M10A and M12B matrixin and adamalysin n=1 Tax=Stanieria cyanosphaera (strain ATCC 29371 / PCC 7437) TaxID=111780 RepID=K9Y0M6_STAC7|nr:matrixin family metalloprotease [Stanieria cyanosphaera]AFZ38293.1 peptidase M10A and M12B matrixin and adamalysin [Stanieria cyanosphaera PCC 7437]
MTNNPTNENQPNNDLAQTNEFELLTPEEIAQKSNSQVHVFGDGVVCDTEPRYIEPRGPEIVLDATNGFIPLWEKNTTLRWRFQQRSFLAFRNPEAAKASIRRLFDRAFSAWGDAAPIKFEENSQLWDFEILVRRNDECDRNGCVLASAFFPNPFQNNQLVIYPQMLARTEQTQVNTLIHEIGHIFGLRHFFAKISETDAPSVVFGVDREVSIMNYGPKSQLTDDDKADLKRLYELVWSGQLTKINQIPIRSIKAFHTTF